MTEFWTKNKIVILLFVVLFTAFFFRFWQLDSIPPGLYPDEAMNGVNALEAIDNGQYKAFYPENNGREGLFINIQAASIALLGNTPLALRIVSAKFGALTIGAVFLFLWLLLQNTSANNAIALRIAFISSLFMSLSFWHLNFSRIGFRAITMPFFLILALTFLILALRNFSKSRLSTFYFLSVGIFLGLGLHGYTPFRLMPLLFVAIFIILAVKKTFPVKMLFWRFCLLAITMTLVFSPLLLHFIKNPNDFSNRHNKIYFFQQEEPVKTLLKTLKDYALMFNIKGDCNSRHNYICNPQLNYVAGIFFLIGFIGLWFKKLRKSFDARYLWILYLGFFFTLLPAILASEGSPHALRSIGTIPFVFAFVGIGIEIAYQKIKAVKSFLIIPFFVLLVITTLLVDPYKYFAKWPKTNPDFSQNYLDEALFLKQFPQYQKIIIVNASTGVNTQGFPTTIMTSKYILWQEFKSGALAYILPEEISVIKEENFVAISMEENQSLIEELKNRFPEAKILKQDFNGGEFTAFVFDKNNLEY